MDEDSKITKKRPVPIGDVYIAPASESAARAAALLPTRPTEDASSLLPPIEVPATQRIEAREYSPNSSTEWVLHVDFVGPHSFSASTIAQLFDTKWKEGYGGLIFYGRDADTGQTWFLDTRYHGALTL